MIDGITALLFEDIFLIGELEKQAKEVIELFAPKLYWVYPMKFRQEEILNELSLSVKL